MNQFLMWHRNLVRVLREVHGVKDDEQEPSEAPRKEAPGVKVHGDAAAQSRLGHINLLGVLGRVPGAIRVRRGSDADGDDGTKKAAGDESGEDGSGE